VEEGWGRDWVVRKGTGWKHLVKKRTRTTNVREKKSFSSVVGVLTGGDCEPDPMAREQIGRKGSSNAARWKGEILTLVGDGGPKNENSIVGNKRELGIRYRRIQLLEKKRGKKYQG